MMKGVFFFLGELNDQDIDWMIKQGKKQHVKLGADLVQEGKPLDKMHLILTGDFGLTVARRGPDVVAKIGVGEVVGEISFIDSRPPSGTVTARAPSEVLSLPLPVLAAKLRDDSGFAARFYRGLAMLLAHRLRAQTLRQTDETGSKSEAYDQLDMNVLDTVHLAGARFQRILARMQSS
jgi:CRP/FNR family transcriptional regulator, cyclic AMP receptor protein